MNDALRFLLGLMIVLALKDISLVDAQLDEREAIILEAPAQDALVFYAVNSTGTISRIGSLPTEFRMVYANVQSSFGVEQGWDIWQPDDIALSPDHRYVAFSAAQRNDKQLFVYRLTSEEVWSIPIYSTGQIRWSPDSRGFVFEPNTRPLNERDAGITYFQLESGQATLLRALPAGEFANRFYWIDSETLVYNFYSAAGGGLGILSLDGERNEVVLSDRLTGNLLDSLCDRAWSAVEQVLYLEVGCTSSPESVIREALLSIDLDGNAVTLLSPPAELEFENLYRGGFFVEGFQVHDEQVYVVTMQYVEDVENGYTSSWNIVRLANGSNTVIYSETLDAPKRFYNPSISPDGRYLVVGMEWTLGESVRSALVVIDLETGNKVREIDTFGYYGWSVVWLNHYTFFYANSSDSAVCMCPYPSLASQLFLVNLAQFPILDLSNEFGLAWLFE